MVSLVAVPVLAALLATPDASPAPALKVIEHTVSSPACTVLHENIATSVGAVLRNDVAIQQAGVAVTSMVKSINSAPEPGKWESADSPWSNGGVAFAQVRLLAMAHRIELNAAQIDAALADPRLASISDQHLLAIKKDLEEAAERQKKLLDVMYAIAYSDHPSNMRYYSYPVQEELRLAIRREPSANVMTGDVFGPFEAIANNNIAKAQDAENRAATEINLVAPGCGDVSADSASAPEAAAPVHMQAQTAADASQPERAGPGEAAARAFYNALVSGSIDRSHLVPALADKLTPSFVQTVSEQLAALKPPTWNYLGQGQSAQGSVSVYRLTYPDGMMLYYSFGANADGTIFAVFLGTQRPPG